MQVTILVKYYILHLNDFRIRYESNMNKYTFINSNQFNNKENLMFYQIKLFWIFIWVPVNLL